MDSFSQKRARQPAKQSGSEDGLKRVKRGSIEGFQPGGTTQPGIPLSLPPHTSSRVEPSSVSPFAKSDMIQVPNLISPVDEDPSDGTRSTPSASGTSLHVTNTATTELTSRTVPKSITTTQAGVSAVSDFKFAQSLGSNTANGTSSAPAPQMVQGTTSTKWKHWKGFTRPISNVFGPVKELAEVFSQCVDTHQMAGQVKSEYDQLQSHLQELFEDLITYFEEGCSPTMTSSMENLRESIKEELEYVRNKRARNLGPRYLAAKDDVDDILACYRRLEGSLQRLLLNANLSMWRITDEQAAESQVNRLSSSIPPWYNSAEGTALKRRGCTPGTRVDVLATILGWVHNRGKGNLYWLNGMAGTGKTTIAYSVSAALDSGHRLGASFFCSRLRADYRNVNLIIPSIAYQLARFSRPFRSALCAVLEKDPDVNGRLLNLQFDALIKRPVLTVEHTLPEELVIVIDALDECDDKDSTQQMIDLLLSEATSLPIRFILSSRPEPEIRSQISKRAGPRLVLHELDKGEVKEDIKTYLREGLAPMGALEAQIEALAEKAGILFIYAATAVRYIGFKNFKRNPGSRLRTVLDGSQGKVTLQNMEIDELYSVILEAAFGEPGLEEDDKIDMQQILHTVVCAREPLTVNGLSELLQIKNADRVRAALDPMWSVLHVVETSELVTTLHASFPDFVLDSARSKTRYCDLKAFNCKLAEHCFQRIRETQPQFNICGLESSYLADEWVSEIQERVDDAIPLELSYACRHWAEHVKAGNRALDVMGHLLDFLSARLLLWMEVLNVSKEMKTGVECMKLMVEWCKGPEGEHELMELVQDAKRFVEVFASNPVSQSTPHIYVSMLAFWPRSSPISKQYGKYTRGPVEPQGTALGRRQMAHLSTWAFEDGATVMNVSPDGSSIALRIAYDVVVVDSSSGRELLKWSGRYPNTIKSIAFSPDGARVIAGLVNGIGGTILGWDTRSGDTVLGPLQLHGHTGHITCLSLSPDCTRVATGSKDSTIRLWNAEDGQIIYNLVTPAKSRVESVGFSPDATRVVAGLLDNWHKLTWHIWDTQAENTSPLQLMTDNWIRDVTFSPDGSRIITRKGDIYVWDAQSGKVITGPIRDPESYFLCISYSPDGRYIISGSGNRTLCVWDVKRGRMVLGPLEVPTADDITSVAFTPDGSRIICACYDGLVCTWDVQKCKPTTDSNTPCLSNRITCAKFLSGSRFVTGSEEGTISVWDVHTGEMIVGPIEAHTTPINAVDCSKGRVVSSASYGAISICNALTGKIMLSLFQLVTGRIWAIAYSPDGRMIATGSDEGVDVWDGRNGQRVLGPLTDLQGRVLSIQFSPDSTRIVGSSESRSSNIAVWNVSNGQAVFGTLDGHSEPVHSVSYSPDGALIASGSDDWLIIVWDTYTGKKKFSPQEDQLFVRSVHFSPDSTRLVSCTPKDRAIRIWDVQVGKLEEEFELQHGHEDWIKSAEYSPDGAHILSLSEDMTVRIHDARSPEERALSHSESEVGDWTIEKDGWVRDDWGNLLVWVPGDLRKALMWSQTRVMLGPQGYLRLKFDKSRLGESWAKSYMFAM